MKPTIEQIYQWLEQVKDPEVPVLSIIDLGILRKVEIINQNTVAITITPTYSGCPAMDLIGSQIKMVLAGRGFQKIQIITQLTPAWTTEWMTEIGRKKLLNYGIAPPSRLLKSKDSDLFETIEINCPKCKSVNTELISNFGATACKALYKCHACKETFEYFKCH